MVSEDLRYKVYAMRRVWIQDNSCRRQVRRHWNGSRRVSRTCGRRRSGLPARLIVNLWTILCVASLSSGSVQSLTTEQPTWSQRSWSWWSPLTGTPWRRPSGGSGSVLRLSSLLTAISLNIPILNMFICLCVFILIKSDDFQLCCVIFKKYW